MTLAAVTDPAMGGLRYARSVADHYPTPSWVTEAIIPTLLDHRPCYSFVLEPACGDGAMSRVLSSHFANVESSDLHNYGFGSSGRNFLELTEAPAGVDMIVTNPPYGDLAEEFIKHSLMLMKPRQGLVAMVLRNEYDSAKGRVDLWKHPFAKKVVLTSRPRWIADSTGAPRHNYSWFIWDYLWAGSPVIEHNVKDRG